VSHDLFGVRQKPGLAEMVAGEARLEAAVVKTPVENLSLLSCGERPVKPSELQSSGKMKELMLRLQKEYDVILLDAPPVLNLPDASILSGFGDNVLLIVQSGRTRCSDVTAAKAILSQVNANITGFIMTNVEYYMPRYVYDYYYEG
jgi:capsular exopolysaccharide synthesis family protein